MKDFIFYLEYPNKKENNKATRKLLGNHKGNCIAVYQPTKLDQQKINGCYECASSVFDHPNSDISWSSVHPFYLAEFCKKVGFETAKSIHPRLIDYLKD